MWSVIPRVSALQCIEHIKEMCCCTSASVTMSPTRLVRHPATCAQCLKQWMLYKENTLSRPEKTGTCEYFGLSGDLTAQILTNQRVISYIPISGVPKMGKFIKELISPFICYGFTMGKLCIVFCFFASQLKKK